jgi:paraquat-inducible protein A
MELLGKWSMLDVLLLALLVMLVKLQSIITFQIGPAAYAFVSCVFLSMAAATTFDPHGMWDESP